MKYLPSVGMVIACSATLWGVVYRYYQHRAWTDFTVILLEGSILLSTMTVVRNRIWREKVTLWKDVVSKRPAKARAHGVLGHTCQRSGH